MAISHNIKSKLRPTEVDCKSFRWIDEKNSDHHCQRQRRIGTTFDRTYYRGFMLNSLAIYEGTNILVKVDEHFGEICENYDIATVIQCYYDDREKDPRRVEVQWYTHIDKVKKTHLKCIPSGLPALDGDLEIVKDMWGYGTDIDIDSIAGICCIVETTAVTEPELVQRPKNAIGPLYICRFVYEKKSPWLIPLTKDTIYRPHSQNNGLQKYSNNPDSPKNKTINATNEKSSSKSSSRKHIKSGLNVSMSPVVSIKKLEDSRKAESNDTKRTVKRKLLDLSPDEKIISKKCRIDSDGSVNEGNDSKSETCQKSKITDIKSIGKFRGLKNSEIYLLLSDDEDLKSAPKKESNLKRDKSKFSDEKSHHTNRVSVSNSSFKNKAKALNSEQPDNTLITSKRKSKITERLINSSIKLSSKGPIELSSPQKSKEVMNSRKPKKNNKTSNQDEVSETEQIHRDCSKKNVKKTTGSSRKSCKTLHKNKLTSSKKSCESVLKDKVMSSRKQNALKKLPSRKTPLHKSKTEFEQARELLHISAAPSCLPCRENEFQEIFSFVEGKLLDSTGGCMYVSGVPGTGKTATVHEVVRILKDCVHDEVLPSFKFIEVNSMKLTKPHQLYVQFWEKLTGSHVTAEHACTLIEKMLSTSSPKPTSILLLLDELDLLWTRKQDVMYNLFDWSSRLHSRLIVVAIANTMDLPERMMISRVSSRLGLTRMTFHPYTFQQLQEIIASRLIGVKAFDPDAIQLVARKVAAVSGDARRALDVCRRATELAEKNPHHVIVTPRKSSPKKNSKPLVGMAHVSDAIDEMFSSPKIMAIRKCSQMVKYILQAILEEFNRIGIEEAVLDKVVHHLQGICRLDGIVPPTSSEILFLINNLSAQRIIFMEHSRLDLALRLRLNISVDDVSYALSV